MTWHFILYIDRLIFLSGCPHYNIWLQEKGACLLCLGFSSQCLEQCLAHSRCLANICCSNGLQTSDWQQNSLALCVKHIIITSAQHTLSFTNPVIYCNSSSFLLPNCFMCLDMAQETAGLYKTDSPRASLDRAVCTAVRPALSPEPGRGCGCRPAGLSSNQAMLSKCPSIPGPSSFHPPVNLSFLTENFQPQNLER